MTRLVLAPPFPPMEATPVDALPAGPEWLFEPKWDGFRCLAFRRGAGVELQSKAERPLTRYFPELVDALRRTKPDQFVLDGEIVIPEGEGLSFDALLARIHPAPARIAKLSVETPATLLVFDLLQWNGKSWLERPLADRRAELERIASAFDAETIVLSPASRSRAQAAKWLKSSGGAMDGVVAKRLDLPYRSGERDGMQKIKRQKTADCVVGGFRRAERSKEIASLLLGLYDDDGLLHHVGFTAAFSEAEREKLRAVVEPLEGPPGFTGRSPGGPSRWSTKRSSEWTPLQPRLVAEVRYDHFSEGRFRHGTKFLRWRKDKLPSQCTFAQVSTSDPRGKAARSLPFVRREGSS